MIPNKESLKSEYFTIANQYYATARFAAVTRLYSVSGNLFHHAIEMYLKGHLCVKMTEKELKDLSHKLKEIWKEFKQDVSDSTLDRFDKTIADLDKHERIRYPERIAKEGLSYSLSFEKNPSSTYTYKSKKRKIEYIIIVDEIDDLVETVFRKSSINPQFFTLSDDAKNYLKMWNKTTIWC